MLAIRLRRTGSKKRPFFRVVVIDACGARQQFRGGARVLQPSHEARDARAEAGSARSLDQGRRRSIRYGANARRENATRPGGTRRGADCIASRCRDVVEVVARALADRPDAVRVTERQHKGQTLVELFMAPGDLGRVIGRQGRTAAAMRMLVNAAADLEGTKATLEFRDDQ